MKIQKALVLVVSLASATLVRAAEPSLDSSFFDEKGSGDALVAKLGDPNNSNLPTVTTQPLGTSAYFGGQATFSVTGSNPAGTFARWFRDGIQISGGGAFNLHTSGTQFTATFTLNRVRPSDDAYYYVEITNQYGTVRSDSVRLVVLGNAPVVVTTLAGTTTSGFQDSATPGAARFNGLTSPAIQNDGAIIIPDVGNNAIRVLDPSGTVGTLAGKGPAAAGLDNGPASLATFYFPSSVAINSAGDIFVADSFNYVIRKISAHGARNVTTYAGTGESGSQDGPAAQAQFNLPTDLLCDPEGNLYVIDLVGHRIRKIAVDGTVTTVAGSGTAGYLDGAAATAQFHYPVGIARDTARNLYVADMANHTIRKITPDGVVSTIAGTPGQRGFVDGPALTMARLAEPGGIAVDNKGNIFFTERINCSVRRIDLAGNVLTLVGTAGQGVKDGEWADAKMLQPRGIAVHPDGSLIVTDTPSHTIRKVVWQSPALPTEAVVLIDLNPSITILGIPGKTYRIETSENLLETGWTILGEVTLQSSVETWFDSQPVTRGQRYYRAVMKD